MSQNYWEIIHEYLYHILHHSIELSTSFNTKKVAIALHKRNVILELWIPIRASESRLLLVFQIYGEVIVAQNPIYKIVENLTFEMI